MSKKNTVVLYHKNCADGFLAAAAIKASGHVEAEYIPVQYGDITADNYDEWAADLFGKQVMIVDFSVKPEVMDRIHEDAESIVWLDHHKTAFEDYALDVNERYSGCLLPDHYPRLVADLDNERSGAMIAWHFMFPGEPVPSIIRYVDDRDRWVWALPETRNVMAGFFASDWDLDTWAEFLLLPKQELDDTVFDIEGIGATLNQAFDKDIEKLAERATPCRINEKWLGTIVNAPHKYASELGHKLAKENGTYALVWSSVGRRVFCSLRGAEGYDVSEIAKMFGGGGHAGAAGFECDFVMLETFMET